MRRLIRICGSGGMRLCRPLRRGMLWCRSVGASLRTSSASESPGRTYRRGKRTTLRISNAKRGGDFWLVTRLWAEDAMTCASSTHSDARIQPSPLSLRTSVSGVIGNAMSSAYVSDSRLCRFMIASYFIASVSIGYSCLRKRQNRL